MILLSLLQEKQPQLDVLYCTYFHAMLDMIQRQQPHIVCHFDLVRLYSPDHPLSKQVWTCVEQCVDAILERQRQDPSNPMLVEINSRGWKKFGGVRAYPGPDILEVIITDI